MPTSKELSGGNRSGKETQFRTDHRFTKREGGHQSCKKQRERRKKRSYFLSENGGDKGEETYKEN